MLEAAKMKFEFNKGMKALLAILALSAAGCSSTPTAYINADPTIDFYQYKSYGFLPTLSTDKQHYESMESNFLKVAVAQELDRRGLIYSENPDLLVNFYINTKEKVRSRSTPTTGGYYGYRSGFYDPWGGYGAHVGYETRIDQYTEGTLNIDFVDASEKKLVWEGAIGGRITDKAIKNLEETIDRAVAAIMKGFPIAP